MIGDMIRAIRDAGIDVPDTVAASVELRIRQNYGGERIYVPSLPKQRRAVQLARLARHTQIEMAQATGLTVRQIRRIQRGR